MSSDIYNSYSEEISRKLKKNQNAIHLQSALDKARTTTYNQVTAINEEYDLNLSRHNLHNFKNSQKPKESQADQLWNEISLLLQKDPNLFKLLRNENNDIHPN